MADNLVTGLRVLALSFISSPECWIFEKHHFQLLMCHEFFHDKPRFCRAESAITLKMETVRLGQPRTATKQVLSLTGVIFQNRQLTIFCLVFMREISCVRNSPPINKRTMTDRKSNAVSIMTTHYLIEKPSDFTTLRPGHHHIAIPGRRFIKPSGTTDKMN